MSKIEAAWNLYNDGKLNIELCKKEIEPDTTKSNYETKHIYDLTGKKINTLNLNMLTDGAYIVIKSNGINTKTEKIFVLNSRN